MKKASINLTIKSLFVVFLVIFVMFIALTSLSTRTTTLQQKQHFDYYTLADQFFISFLSNPSCVTVGDYSNISNQIPVQGLLSFEKLNKLDKTNMDIGCSETYHFLYTVEVIDMVNGKTWVVGLDDQNYNWVEREIKTSLPVAIRYHSAQVNLGEAILHVYTGQIPLFYGTINKACNLRSVESFELINNQVITYNHIDNKFCVANDCFNANFKCPTNSFRVSKGDHIIAISYKEQNITVVP
jgi:hypothetical protein